VKKFILLALLVPALSLAIYDMKWFDLNHWRSPFYNDGRWGIDITQGAGVAAGTWPQPLHNCYVFGAGAWIGAVDTRVHADTLVTDTYNPNSGGTEISPTLCRYWPEGDTNVLDRIYVHPGDWPPPQTRFPMAPQDPRSDMELWCGFSDADPSLHISPGRPLGIDVYLTVCGYDDSLAQDFFFLRYELANCSGDSIRQTYFGMVLDPDIGGGTDDMTGLILDHLFQVGPDTIRVKNTGFAYDYDNIENPGGNWESGTPGALVVMLLDAPGSLGLTAFKRFPIDIDPVTDAAQYLTLAGYNYRTGVYEPYDSTDLIPADVRMLLSTGPFDLAPDSTVTFWYAVICSPFGDSGQYPPGRDTSELALRCKWAREYFERLSGIAEQPPTPRSVQPLATIVRGILFLPWDMTETRSGVSDRVPRPVLLDATGRRVMSLRPGANDVSRLPTGVYFVQSPTGDRQSIVRKVVLTR